ncbi:hypothetical protein NBRC116494_35290 [Aurantivibrio plasticivorans]
MKRFNFDYGKYRGILISVALFLLLDASVLIVNFYMSFQISEDAIGVNLAGRQRMLSQRMTKSLFIMQSADENSDTYESAFNELQSSKNLFDATFNAFLYGGTTKGAKGESLVLAPVATEAAINALNSASELWGPYKEQINNVIASQKEGISLEERASVLASAMTIASANNVSLLTLMNDLTVSLEQVASSKASRLRLIQTIGISLAIVNFLFIMMHFLRQLRDSDAVLEKARKETTEILDTVKEGLFLVDENLDIGHQHSAILCELFGTEKIGGQSLDRLLESIVSGKQIDTAKDFISLLFDDRVKENLIGDLNPLHEVEVNLAKDDGGFITKYLQFSFARVYLNDGNISHVLVTVQDITEQIKLGQALKESQKHNETQLEMITTLLHSQPSMHREFIQNAHACYNRINDLLRTTSKSKGQLLEKAQRIFREIHNFKGEASALNFDYFENQAHLIEDTLSDIQRNPNVTGNDFLKIAVQLETLINYTFQVEELMGKLAQFGVNQGRTDSPDSAPEANPGRKEQWAQLSEFVTVLAERQGKKAALVTSGLSDIELDEAKEKMLRNVCIQLLRNAVTHGVETPEVRKAKGKPEIGRIDLRIAKVNGCIEFCLMDDGSGIDYEAIRSKLATSGQWDNEEIKQWDHKRLASMIFQSGLSTAKQLSKDAGRGVGMEAVLSQISDNSGKINISSRRDQYCRFTITLPIDEQTARAA